MYTFRKFFALPLIIMLVTLISMVSVVSADDPGPAVTVADQDIVNSTITISEVVSIRNGWIVIHRDENGAPGAVIGYAAVAAGSSQDISVKIDVNMATTQMHAMLHIDVGEPGVFEFPGVDVPVVINGSPVMSRFIALNLQGAPPNTLPVTGASSADVRSTSLVWVIGGMILIFLAGGFLLSRKRHLS